MVFGPELELDNVAHVCSDEVWCKCESVAANEDWNDFGRASVDGCGDFSDVLELDEGVVMGVYIPANSPKTLCARVDNKYVETFIFKTANAK